MGINTAMGTPIGCPLPLHVFAHKPVDSFNRLNTILHADRIFVLEQGHVVEEGRHEGLVDRKGLYHAMWRGA